MPPTERVLIPIDVNQSSQQLVAHARELAQRSPTELHLLYVIPSPRLPRALGESVETRLHESRHRLERLVQPLLVEGFRVVLEVRTGRPAREIVAYAREKSVDQISMTTRARTALASAVLGSVAEQVVRLAHCPVLILPPHRPADDRSRVAAAVQVLASSFGATLEGSYDETWNSIVSVVGRDLGLETAEAGQVVAELRAVHVLDWNERPASDTEASASFWSIDIAALSSSAGKPSAPVNDEPAGAGDASIAVDLIRRAVDARASDIHLDPKADDLYEVGFRIDGRIEHYCDLDRGIASPLLQQLKVMAGLDIAEPFLPQEGRLGPGTALPDVDVRITTAPVQGGAAMALRILRRDQVSMPLQELGLLPPSLEEVGRCLHAGAGLLLVTGPTGSGKTTTVYSLLHELGGRGRKIVSIEDPIEFPMPYVRQLGVDPRHHLTMTEGLRTILRMDPDIVAVSEIRDSESAEIAMRAASSGRFVFSTLHTRDVASTVTAVRDLHIDNRSIAANLTGIIAQRLVRRLCPGCAVGRPITDAERAVFDAEQVEPPATLLHPVGCSQCRGTGFHGRIGVFEVVLSHGEAEAAIETGAPEDQLRTLLRSSGSPSLLADALMKVRSGVTSLVEAQEMKWI